MEVKERLLVLLVQLQKENLDVFDEFYSLTKKSVYFAIYLILKDEHTTQDLMQETYIDFLDYKNKLKLDIDVMAYLVQSAKNKALNYYKKNKYEKEYVGKYINESYDNQPLMDTGLLKTIKEMLDPKEFDVFTLKVLGEYSFKEISKIRKIPIGTCTWLYQEARNKLKEKLGGIK